MALFGLVFGGMGLLFVWIFFPWRFVDDWRLASEAARRTPGVITQVRQTGLTLNRTRVYEFGFRYTPAGASARQGLCFTTGQRWNPGAAVTVRYLPAEPELAAVDGARLTAGGWGGAFVLVFPLIGGSLVAFFLVNRRNRRRLLRDGLATEVNVVSVEATMTQVNRRPLCKITLTAPDFNSGQPLVIFRANEAEVALARQRAADKQTVYLLHDPQKPSHLLFPEALLAADPSGTGVR